jgi:hypothetical protein
MTAPILSGAGPKVEISSGNWAARKICVISGLFLNTIGRSQRQRLQVEIQSAAFDDSSELRTSSRAGAFASGRIQLAATHYQPSTLAKMRGATMVASDSMMNRGVAARNFPQVIFSFGTAPEYDPKLVVESLIWQK